MLVSVACVESTYSRCPCSISWNDCCLDVVSGFVRNHTLIYCPHSLCSLVIVVASRDGVPVSHYGAALMMIALHIGDGH